MGVENADDAATWKATMSILRRQKLLPLLEEVEVRGEEDTISIVVFVRIDVAILRSVQDFSKSSRCRACSQVVL